MTASGGNSASGLHCLGWSATAPNAGRVGALGATGTTWSLTASGEVCSTEHHVYCVEQ